MEKYKYLLKNVGIMTLASFGTKILSFLMVPLYTNVLSTEAYGTYDIYQTTLFLLVPVLSLNIADGIMRFSLDEIHNKQDVFMVGVRKYIIACLLCVLIVMINQFFSIIKTLTLFPQFFILYFVTSLMADVLNNYARGIEKVSAVAVGGIIGSIAMLTLNLLFLLVFKWGLVGYFLANCFSFVCTDVYLFIKLKIWRAINWKAGNQSLKKEMVAYSVPMGLGNIGWWVNNVSDRYIVTWISGIAANGVYSVAYKIPSLLSMFQQIFNQAWTISAVKEYDQNSSDFYSTIYKVYNMCMTITCAGLILFDRLIARILFGIDFYEAWKYAPYLMISVVFGAMVQLLGGIFSAAKESKAFGSTILIGAVVNTILNVILVYTFGPLGAAIATSLSYMLIWVLRLYKVTNQIKLNIQLPRDVLSYVLLYIQATLLVFYSDNWNGYIIQTGLFISIIVLYFREFVEMIKKILLRVKKRQCG